LKNDFSNKLAEHLLSFAVNTIKLVQGLEKSPTGYHIGKQLLKSATSAGANYEEACWA
jgi:four helix bundle protein